MYDEELCIIKPESKASTRLDRKSSKTKHTPRDNRIKNRKLVSPNITCHIENCKNYGRYCCDKDLLCSNKWKSCKELLCQDHCESPGIGNAHCFSDPKTDCQQRYDFAKRQNKKEMGICLSMCTILVVLILWIYVWRGTIH